MSRFPGKKLPPGWLYVPSRRQVRDLLRGLAADVRRVDFGGTGSGLRSGSLSLGYVERRVVDGEWCFFVQLWGVPEAAVEGLRDELAKGALRAIGQSVAECLAAPAVEVVKPSQLLLRFDVGEGGVVPACKVETVGAYSFSAGPWWAAPGRA